MISIIIVHWNTPESLDNCLGNLTDIQNEIIVIDNASEKNIDWIFRKFPAVEVIQNRYNRGYASACNQGVLKAKNDWLLFLNPDVVTNKDEIETLLQYAKENSSDAVTPYTKESYAKPVPSTLSLLAEFTPLKYVIPLSLFKTKTVFGGFLLIKTKVLRALGGWDERFFVWFEDSDLTKRLNENRHKVDWIKMDIKHAGGASFNQFNSQFKRDLFFNSMEVYATKHFTYLGKKIVSIIKKKYTKKTLIPSNEIFTSVTVPNIKVSLLDAFIKDNLDYLKEIELVIVSSGITDNTVWKYRNLFAEVRFIPIKKNFGFASTVNIGLRVSRGSTIGTINDDVIINEKTLPILQSYLTDDIGSINPLIYRKDGRLESAGIKIHKNGRATPLSGVPEKNITVVDATNGAAVLYNKTALDSVGIFDERFGSYLEDIDLSLRLNRAGYKNIVARESSIIHEGHATSKNIPIKKAYLDFKNWILLIGKNWSILDKMQYFPSILIERLRNLSGVIKTIIKTSSRSQI